MDRKEIIKTINTHFDALKDFEDMCEKMPEGAKEEVQAKLTATFNKAVSALDKIIATLEATRENEVWNARIKFQEASAKLWNSK